MRQVQHQPFADRIGHLGEYDRYGLALFLESGYGRRAVDQD